jgi:transposase
MVSHPLAAFFPGFTIKDTTITATLMTITAVATMPAAACPACGTPSSHIHSYYTRSPRDLPISGRAVRLELHVRRFRCREAACARVTFAERLPDLLAATAQRTVRLNTALTDLGMALGGEAGARQSERAAMPASPATLLRRVRQTACPPRPTPRVLGVDDFAFRKGRVYGTILTDGETHQGVDLLPDRRAETLAAWLRAHPDVEFITRDRSTEYARGVAAGAPEAVQVADRWHVLGNLQEALERLLTRLRPQLQALPTGPTADSPAAPSPYDRDLRRGTKDQVRQQASRARRYARYAQVKQRQAQGHAILQIARDLHLSRQTVRNYMASEIFPEYPQQPRQPSMLDPYVVYLQEYWEAGCQDNRQLLEHLRGHGYPGSLRPIVQWTMLRRPLLPDYRPRAGRRPARQVKVFMPPDQPSTPSRATPNLLPTRRLVWLLLPPQERLDAAAQAQLALLQQLPEVAIVYPLTQQFRAMLHQRSAVRLTPWLAACRATGIGELMTFADGLQRDEPLIRTALELPYSNGVTEGHVNRLKMIKRTMYGRAGFQLLRQRVLATW